MDRRVQETCQDCDAGLTTRNNKPPTGADGSDSMTASIQTGQAAMRVEDPRDSTKRYFRANKRLFVLNGAWYFSTREGEVGPFPCREVAEAELDRFKQELSELQKFQKTREEAKEAFNREGVAAPESIAARESAPVREDASARRAKRQPPRDPGLKEVLV